MAGGRTGLEGGSFSGSAPDRVYIQAARAPHERSPPWPPRPRLPPPRPQSRAPLRERTNSSSRWPTPCSRWARSWLKAATKPSWWKTPWTPWAHRSKGCGTARQTWYSPASRWGVSTQQTTVTRIARIDSVGHNLWAIGRVMALAERCEQEHPEPGTQLKAIERGPFHSAPTLALASAAGAVGFAIFYGTSGAALVFVAVAAAVTMVVGRLLDHLLPSPYLSILWARRLQLPWHAPCSTGLCQTWESRPCSSPCSCCWCPA